MTAPGVTPTAPSAGPSSINHGLCTLSFQNQVFRFRTNPSSIWWSYELISNEEETFGGRVIQILGTRLGELAVTVECGQGGYDYLMSVVYMLRNLMSDQRNGNPATFEYTTRNWKLNVYSMSIPFQDQFDATVRELPLNFKIQEDVTSVISQVTLDAAFARLQDGVYSPGMALHNQYNDSTGIVGGLDAATGGLLSGLLGGIGDPIAPGGPTYLASGITNMVDMMPFGNNPGGLNPLGMIPFMPSIPGLSFLGL